MITGIHYKIDAKAYLTENFSEAPALSSSIAKILWEKTPEHAFFSHPALNVNYKEKHKKDFDIGTAAHSLLLENDQDAIVVISAEDYRKKDAQTAKADAYEAGKTPLLTKQWLEVSRMVTAAKAFLAKTELGNIEEDYDTEVTMVADADGVLVKGRIDALSKTRKILIDYKTTENASPKVFEKQIRFLNHDIQAGFYLHLNKLTGGPEDAIFVWLVQETEPPYSCSLVGCSPAMLALADRKVKWAISKWRSCLATSWWPAYPPSIAWVEPAGWEQAQAEEFFDNEENKEEE